MPHAKQETDGENGKTSNHPEPLPSAAEANRIIENGARSE